MHVYLTDKQTGSQYDRVIATMDPRTFMLGFRFDFSIMAFRAIYLSLTRM